MQGLLS